ncbi:MAG TPA: hypothetical protein VLR94_09190 [Acidobacteriota bacterium]|nr:hypothetical protein [Acidobacteriota bacterium]
MRTRIGAAGSRRMEFVAGIRVNGAPHIGTYLTLASVFVFASKAQQSTGIPCAVHIHFLDNDPVPPGSDHPATHFHCVYQTRTAAEGAVFIRENYGSYLDELSALTGCPYDSETYSTAQGRPEFRSAVLRSLREWSNIKYYVSGQPLIDAPNGVRGIGSPCPLCGLFNGRLRPSVDVVSEQSATLTAECCRHGEYCASLTPSNGTFVNLETGYRNAIKEILALTNRECLSIMMKGTDWKDGLRCVDMVLGMLGVVKTDILPRFLVPVVRAENGIKLSKSAILLSPGDFKNLPSCLLDMKVLRQEISDYTSRILSMAEEVLGSPAFSSAPVLPVDVLRMLVIS